MNRSPILPRRKGQGTFTPAERQAMKQTIRHMQSLPPKPTFTVLLPGPSLLDAHPSTDSLTFAVNSASLYYPHDFLCFRDLIVKERLIDTGRVNPLLGYVTDIPSFDNKVHLCPQYDLASIRWYDDPLRYLVTQKNHFTSHFAFSLVSQMCQKGDRVEVWGMDFTLEPTLTDGIWHSQHTLHSYLKEVVWLRLVVGNLLWTKEVEFVIHGEMNFFHHYVLGDIDSWEFLMKFKKEVKNV